MTNSEAARTAEIAAAWDRRPERVVTLSTGVVHVAFKGMAMCGTRQSVKNTADGTTPTCKKCGAR